MKKQSNILETENEDWGFWGTMDAKAPKAWPIAMVEIAKATKEPMESVRAFLDSKLGRHFADAVLNRIFKGTKLKDAIILEAAEWMIWRTDHWTKKEYGIPKGLPYLAAHVVSCGIYAEEEAAL